ncbi:hypothetical protein QZH41_001477 [Actinostola sp. cb2023]|nr:hypothetical protein QZH41_001477 [Actinostola sp. cb2023]
MDTYIGALWIPSPSMGDIQLGLCYRKAALEVEVIRAKGLLPKPNTKMLPAPYIKVYVMEGKRCIAKKKTRTARRTLEPLYQQCLDFKVDIRGKTLQVIVWGDYGRMDRKVFMGVVQILLDDLDLSSLCMGWTIHRSGRSLLHFVNDDQAACHVIQYPQAMFALAILLVGPFTDLDEALLHFVNDDQAACHVIQYSQAIFALAILLVGPFTDLDEAFFTS